MKKVLLISNPHCGGAERMTVLFGKLLQKQGYDIQLLICKAYEDECCDILSFVPEDFKVSYTTGRYRSLFFRLYSFLKKNSADYVYSSFPLINHLIIPLVKLRFRKKKVVIREFNTPSRHSGRIRFLNKALYRYADGIISQTEEMAQEMARLYKLSPERITTVINPVDGELIDEKIKECFEYPCGHTIYVAVGRVQPQKDYGVLIRAFAKVLEKNPSSLLYVVGKDEGEYADAQKNLVAELGLQANVIFTGFQENPYKYMAAADCYVLSSEYEGLPNTLLEAMYLNLHVVATASVPFIPAQMDRYPKGRCVPVKDVERFAQSMLEVIDVDLSHEEMSSNLQQTNLEPLFQLFR